MKSTKTAGLCGTRAADRSKLNLSLTARIARTKAALVHAYHYRGVSFQEAEAIAARLRERYSQAWRSA